ncbi:MAG TPA: protein kinase [Planctomycetaceae bacterium]|jgi:tetratricopeptide (TPR) repeat protein/tRNA A-37 threonylcarbamoyl transferase component Bud32|nr:protein kinase [Planctomycetaceae bacterium]
MIDKARIHELLETLLESDSTPEEVCAACPELLPEVRSRWRRLQTVQNQVDELFPSSAAGGDGERHPGVTPDSKLPQIAGYEVRAILGYGGVGMVYKARHLKLKRDIALKMLLLGAYARPHERERFVREAEAVAGLQHPNIVQVYDVGEFEGRPYFTMELMNGGSFSQQLAGAPQSPRHSAQLLATLATAVAYAHEQGIVHRDLKPANILLTSDGLPKIADFGLARRLDSGRDLTLTGAMLGTPSYMAPEQASGKASEVGPAADVYGLGAILYEMLAGRPPFRGDTPAETQRQVLVDEPSPPSKWNAKIPRDLETVCLKCLQKLPQHRYSTALEFAEDLGRFQRGEPIAARPVSRPERVVRWARRKPTAAALAVAALALFCVAVTYGANEWRLAATRRAEVAQWEPRLELVSQLEAEGKFQEARALLQRLPDADVGPLKDQIRAALTDLELAQNLDRIRNNRVAVVDGRFDLASNRARSDHDYEVAFVAASLGTFQDAPAPIATAVAGSPIRAAVIAALDDWSVCTSDESRRQWILEVARKADPDPSGWRDRVRVAGLSKQSLTQLAETAVVRDQSVQLLVALAQRMQVAGADPTEFLRRVQEQYPGDFWACFTLADALNGVNFEECVRFYQAALAIRPETAVAHHNVGRALGLARRNTDTIPHFREAVRLEPRFSNAVGHLAMSLSLTGQGAEALELAKHAVSLDARSADNHNSLGYVFLGTGQVEQALVEFRRAIACDPAFEDAHEFLANTLMDLRRLDEAKKQLEEFRRDCPNSAAMHMDLGRLLVLQGHRDEAVAEFQESIRLNPHSWVSHYMLGELWRLKEAPQRALLEFTRAIEARPNAVQAGRARRGVMLQLGLGEEARIEWANGLVGVPTDHDDWYGYAELCLYLGNQVEYKRACHELLGRFEVGADPRLCEKVGRACLIGTVGPEDRKRAAALIERALHAQLPAWDNWLRPYFQLVEGLARYRAGDFGGTIESIQGEVLGVHGPLPHLVVSMAQARVGRRDQALGSLATAIGMYDWKLSRIRDQDGCIYHSLRREAQGVVMPNLTQLLAGHEKPGNQDEQMALAVICQSMQRTAQAVALYAEAFKKAPAWSQRWRYAAACCAARAGCGDGEDAAQLNETQRAASREQARIWLRDDLTAMKGLLARAPTTERAALPGKLETWFKDPALACVRDEDKLKKLPSAERAAWVQFWHDAEALRAEARSTTSKTVQSAPSAAK